MKRFEKILALLMLLIYTTASTGSAAAALLCNSHCHCQHLHTHHSQECVCHGLSFEAPCDGHTHVQYTGAYADRMEDSRQASISSLIPVTIIVFNYVDDSISPAVDEVRRCPFVDTPPPLGKAHTRVSALRAPPALV